MTHCCYKLFVFLKKMSLPFFYEPTLSQNESVFTLSEESSKHAIQVLRMKADEQLIITNGLGLSATATIISDHKKHATVSLSNFVQKEKNAKTTCIAISPVKNNSRFEWFLEKATEIGISEIIPLICERTEKEHFKHERMNGILISAMLQSQQTWLPVLKQPTKFKNLFEANHWQTKLIAHCREDQKQSLRNFILNHVQILIGPEGDFTENEINSAIENGYQPVTLGETRLRTETAGIFAAVLLTNG